MPLCHPGHVRQRRRLSKGPLAAVLAVSLGVAAYLFFPMDRTRGLSPEAVAAAAGRAILEARGYRFAVELTGEALDQPFPTARMNGEFQRTPPLLHITGEARSGESTVALEYYLDGSDLYVRSPQDRSWMLLRTAHQGTLHLFQPNDLATLLQGLTRARVLGRERLPGGEAVAMELELDPAVMQPRLGASPGRAEYRLWVYTRSLKPARFLMEMRAPPSTAAPRQPVGFTYVLNWDFRRPATIVVPDQVRKSAREQ